jgi:hypothetical protein
LFFKNLTSGAGVPETTTLSSALSPSLTSRSLSGVVNSGGIFSSTSTARLALDSSDPATFTAKKIRFLISDI